MLQPSVSGTMSWKCSALQEFEKEFLGEIPINPEVGKTSDEGKPLVEANPDHEISKIYLDFANKIKSTYL